MTSTMTLTFLSLKTGMLAAARLMIRAERARRAAAAARAVEASALSAKRNTGDAADGKPADDRVSVGETVFASNGVIVGYLLLSLLVCGWGLSVLTMLSSDSMQRVLSSAPPPSHPPFPPAPPGPPMSYRYLRPPPPSPSPPQPPSTPTPPGLPPTPLWPVGGSPFHVSGPCRRVGACVTSSNFDVRSVSDFSPPTRTTTRTRARNRSTAIGTMSVARSM